METTLHLCEMYINEELLVHTVRCVSYTNRGIERLCGGKKLSSSGICIRFIVQNRGNSEIVKESTKTHFAGRKSLLVSRRFEVPSRSRADIERRRVIREYVHTFLQSCAVHLWRRISAQICWYLVTSFNSDEDSKHSNSIYSVCFAESFAFTSNSGP